MHDEQWCTSIVRCRGYRGFFSYFYLFKTNIFGRKRATFLDYEKEKKRPQPTVARPKNVQREAMQRIPIGNESRIIFFRTQPDDSNVKAK